MRKALWDLDCLTRDTVVSLAFNPREIRELLEQEEIPLQSEADEMTVMAVIHSRTGCPSALAMRLDSILHDRGSSARNRIRFLEPDQISLSEMSNEDPAGLLFALATDARKPIQTLTL